MIRRAIAGDAAALTALAMRAKAHWGYDRAFLDACEPELTVTAAHIAAAELHVFDDGFGARGFYRLDVRPPTAELAMLFVAPAAIGHGFGAALWRHAVDLAAARGATTLTLESDPNAEGFYRRMGARRAGTAKSKTTGRMLPLMVIQLAAPAAGRTSRPIW